MWDTVEGYSDHFAASHLSHDMPCQRCGHATHTYLKCDDNCDCAPVTMPGALLLTA
jgi:hypothetical protein